MNLAHDPISVEISDTQDHVAVDAAALAGIARCVLRMHGVEEAAVSVAIVDDAGIRRVHAEHLDDDTPTDVITFDLSEPGSGAIEGELVVSAETAARAAASHSIAPEAELVLYIVHGLLHLCGFDDRDDAARAAMRAREAQVLQASGIDHPGA